MTTLRVLFIDDEDEIREVLSRLLERLGHTVVAARDGQEGLALFVSALQQGQPFDLVITDWGMPHLNGGQVAKAVKEQSPETVVLLLSGWDSRERLDEETLQCVDMVLDKPVTRRELERAIRTVMGDRLRS